MSLINIGFLAALALILMLVLAIFFRTRSAQQAQAALPAQIMLDMETRHRAVLSDLHTGLDQQSDRMQTRLTELQVAQTERLAETRAAADEAINESLFLRKFGTAGQRIVIEDFLLTPNSNIAINDNIIAGNAIAGLEVGSLAYSGGAGSLNAEQNWWGSPTGPTIASNPGGTGDKIIDPAGVVDYTPFRTAAPDADNDGIIDACDAQVGPPTNKDQCKNGGWMNFNSPRTFKNQGDCIQYVNTGK